MTIGKTVALSLCAHALALLLLLVSAGNSVLAERIFMVEIKKEAQGGIAPGPGNPVPAVKERSASKAQRLQSNAAHPRMTSPEVKAVESPATKGGAPPEPTDTSAVEEAFSYGALSSPGSSSRDNTGLTVSVFHGGGTGQYQTGRAGDEGASGSGDNHPDFIRRIREAIEKSLSYPALARKRRLEGIVVAEFSISPAGLPENVRIVRSAGTLLDGAASESIRKAAPFPFLKGTVEVPIRFRLDKEEAGLGR